MFTYVYPCLLVFTYFYNCLRVYLRATLFNHASLPIFTHV